MKRAIAVTLAVLSLPGAIGCGEDDDDDSSAAGTAPAAAQAPGDSEAAQLEAYLKKNTADIKGEGTKRGQVISHVEAVDGGLKIWTLLNGDVAVDDKPARQICGVALESGVPEAEGAPLVDAGGVEMVRCRP
ncbi:MAG TPA: hypothetical protein VD790_04455 [Thermoleophilaceae bacterium]|nr:hypothetical protein [Thermoleophilaceae bacterium]